MIETTHLIHRRFLGHIVTISAFTGALLIQGCSSSSSDDNPANTSAQSSSLNATSSTSSFVESSSSGSSSSEAAIDNEKTSVLDCGPVAGNIENNRLNNQAKTHLLCRHNQTRSTVALGKFEGLYGNFPYATNMKRLQWDTKLEAVAQAWANQCKWEHNAMRTQEYNALAPTDIHGQALNSGETVGENLAYQASTSLTAANLEFAHKGYTAMEAEGHFYSLGQYSVNDHCDQAPCGHFTQQIWANTYKVGCAVNFCPANSLSVYPATFLVCNYASAGNYINQEPYKTSTLLDDVCSEGDTGQTVCKNGLTQAASYSLGL